MRNVIIAGNWKMNKTNQEGIDFVSELKASNLDNYDAKKLIFVPSIMLSDLAKEAINSDLVIGAQNMHQDPKGAYTGEISAQMLKSIGIKYILIGHSERRQFFNETDMIVNQKLKLAIENELVPTVCVGETLEEREANITNTVLETQIKGAFSNIDINDMSNVIIAYEPVWAIGTGLVATPTQANEACSFVRKVVASIFDNEVAENIVIQYGGSVSPANVDEIMSQTDIDGALVGGASLEVDSYLKLLK